MLNLLASIFLGWPAIVATVILSFVGLFRRDHRFLVGAAFLAFPFSMAISGFPVISIPAFCNVFLPLLMFLSAFLLSRGHEMLAWLFVIPFYLAIMLLLFTVMAGNA
jgi:hypothetical protein